LFPTTTFRLVYDQLADSSLEKADREYVRILHLAASTSESEVEVALSLLLETSTLPTFDTVRDLVHVPGCQQVLDLPPPQLDLSPYDQLIPSRRTMPKTTNRSGELHTLLTQLTLTRMAEVCAEVALRAAKEGLSHEAYLYELARQEWEVRTQRRIARLIRQSGLSAEKTFRTLALSRFSPALQLQVGRLKNAAFLDQAAM
jgi:hypothetical protein